ncbi:ABC transporter ATP-binding protein [Microbacterium abyssi]|uniref:ABC transporter ATP-binding protein n=1 Tax=Microbacterium abyssi TaxID=2782166 RepID=UPI0018894658|nr:ABC transporter ATP-binding protein [Microbacterium sp. A18JL241]
MLPAHRARQRAERRVENDVLELISDMRDGERTIVAVLHDINQASRFATHLIAMKDGRIVAEGRPGDIVTAELIHELFGLDARVIIDRCTGARWCCRDRAENGEHVLGTLEE